MTPSGCPQCAELGRQRDKEELVTLRAQLTAFPSAKAAEARGKLADLAPAARHALVMRIEGNDADQVLADDALAELLNRVESAPDSGRGDECRKAEEREEATQTAATQVRASDWRQPPSIVAPENRKWCGGVDGRTHKRVPGGICRGNHDGDNDGAPDPLDDVRAAFVGLITFVAKAKASNAAKEEAMTCIELLQSRLL